MSHLIGLLGLVFIFTFHCHLSGGTKTSDLLSFPAISSVQTCKNAKRRKNPFSWHSTELLNNQLNIFVFYVLQKSYLDSQTWQSSLKWQTVCLQHNLPTKIYLKEIWPLHFPIHCLKLCFRPLNCPIIAFFVQETFPVIAWLTSFISSLYTLPFFLLVNPIRSLCLIFHIFDLLDKSFVRCIPNMASQMMSHLKVFAFSFQKAT